MSKYAKGKHAYSICQRSGLRYPYNEMVKEPGTGLWVHRSESDGRYNRVNHPQNHIKGKSDNPSLRNVYPDTHAVALDYLVDTSGNLVVGDRGQFGHENYVILE